MNNDKIYKDICDLEPLFKQCGYSHPTLELPQKISKEDLVTNKKNLGENILKVWKVKEIEKIRRWKFDEEEKILSEDKAQIIINAALKEAGKILNDEKLEQNSCLRHYHTKETEKKLYNINKEYERKEIKICDRFDTIIAMLTTAQNYDDVKSILNDFEIYDEITSI